MLRTDAIASNRRVAYDWRVIVTDVLEKSGQALANNHRANPFAPMGTALSRRAHHLSSDALSLLGAGGFSIRAAFLAALRADQRARNRLKTRTVMGATT